MEVINKITGLFTKKITEEIPQHYTSIRYIPVYNFHKVLETGDKTFLYVDEKGEQDLSETWKNIYNEYCIAAKINNRYIKLIDRIDDMILKHSTVSGLLRIFPYTDPENRIETCELLREKNFLIDLKKPLQPQYDKCVNQLKSLATRIKIEKAKLPKEEKKEAVSLMRRVVGIENAFPGRNIDIYTMTMEKWIALEETFGDLVKMRRKVNSKK